MTKLAEILQAAVAMVLVAGDIYLHARGVNADGVDTFAGMVAGFYFGGKVYQTMTGNNSSSYDGTAAQSVSSGSSGAAAVGPGPSAPAVSGLPTATPADTPPTTSTAAQTSVTTTSTPPPAGYTAGETPS
jgi:hypothetical protein